MMISIANNVNDFGISPYSARSLISRRNNTPSSTPTLPQKSTNLRSSIELLSANTSATLEFLELISRAREGLKYHAPELCEEGVNGTYFLKDKNGSKIAIFKPQDEEGGSENNPKRNLNETESNNDLPNKGILPGEAAVREVAAYLLDSEGFYGVPRTQIVKVTHDFNRPNTNPIAKIGSLQEFIENDGCSEDFGSRSFPVNEVQKIAILDIQILNVDRHAGNILIQKSRDNNMTLIPIDHGFSLPDNLECSWFEWMNWTQSKMPIDDNLKSYISRIDVEKNAQLLQKELGIRNECLNMMRISTTLLKQGVEYGLTLFEIGNLLCRRTLESPSTLEILVKRAHTLSTSDEEKELPLSAIEKLIVEEIKSIKQRNLGKSPRIF